eukprot:COSAG02_NODE_37943_length_435_cov_1.044643_2_plen_60_part_01
MVTPASAITTTPDGCAAGHRLSALPANHQPHTTPFVLAQLITKLESRGIAGVCLEDKLFP